MRIKQILCPVELSHPMPRALKEATWLAWSLGSKLHVLHLAHTRYQHGSLTPAEIERELRDHILRCLAALVLHAEDSIDFDVDLGKGLDPVSEILEIVTSKDIDLIVMGKDSPYESVETEKSVCEQVLRKASCPVFINNLPGPKRAGYNSERIRNGAAL